MIRFLAALLFLAAMLPAMAQDSVDSTEEERSIFTTFIQNRLSTPNRRISISGIRGALSSEATIGEITVADREGVWLRIVGASINWSRSALLLRQRLQVQRLAAERIEVLRRPLPNEGLPAPESRSFQIPELPIAINLEQLQVPTARFGQGVFGLASELSLNGALRIEAGTLDTNLDIQRLDGPGGQLRLDTAFSNETRELSLDLALEEPENGVVANLLNIEGRPPLSLTLSGEGPLSALDVKLALAADGVPTFGGTLSLRERNEGTGFSARFAGPIARLVPAKFRSYFGSGSIITANGVARESGGVLLENLRLSNATTKFEAAAETSADGFLTALSLDANVANINGERVLLPVAGGETFLQTANLNVTYGEAGSERWSGMLTIDGLQTAEFSAGKTELSMGGFAQNLNQPDQRRVSFEINGGLSEITAERREVAEALGDAVTLDVAGDWRAGTPVVVEKAELSGNGLAVTLDGTIDALVFNGNVGVSAGSLAPFSALAGQNLGGSVDLTASGTVTPISGGFDLDVDGTANELRLGDNIAGRLFAGSTTIDGVVARNENGLTARLLRLVNEQLTFEADGTYATGSANFRFDAALADMALLSEQAQGRLTASGRAEGGEGRINLTLAANAPSGELTGKNLSGATLAFDGQVENSAITGQFIGDALFAGEPVALSGGVIVDETARRLSNFSFRASGAEANGALALYTDGLIEGQFDVDAPDISTTAALFLKEASGAARASIALRPDDGRQQVEVDATLRNLDIEGTTVSNAEVVATASDVFGVPAINGSLEAEGVAAGNFVVTRLEAQADQSGQTTQFTANAMLEQGTRVATDGALSPEGEGYRVSLDQLTLNQGDVAARLVSATSLLVQGNHFTLEPFDLEVAGGRVRAEGEITDTLNLDLAIQRLPLSIANTIRPDLALSGSIDGTASVRGTREDPQINFDVTGRQIAASALRQAGLSTLAVDATGTTNGNRLNIDTRITSPEGLNATASGDVPLDDGALALDVNLAAFPLSVLNRVVPGQQLAGQLSGNAHVAGTLARPEADFDMRATGLSAAPLSSAGLGPLSLNANGRYARDVLHLAALRVSGPSGLSVEASGNIPVVGNTMAVNVSGSAPLSVANRFLADRGTQLSGTVSARARVTGNPRSPVINGTVSTANAAVVDPLTNVRANDIRLAASIAGERITISEGSAALAAGGRVSITGNISTNAPAGFPADLAIRLDNARYADGELVTATVNGALSLNGPLTRDPLLAGNINIERAEILVPESLGGGAAGINVHHVAPPPAVQQTLKRARAEDGTPMPSSRPSVMRLNVNVTAPARIFVRGRGLDAELGGAVSLTGPVTNIQPVGAFDLIRGRLSILTQRITFEEGRVTLIGDLDPQLYFLARSQSSDITVFITVEGRISDLDITFSSQPELPQDEVLARLIFNRGIDDLSALQIAQLAAAAAELAGGGSNNSLIGSLRNATGLDDLDIVSDEEGNTAVRAGRYVQDNIYLGVEAGSRGTTRGTVNLDITNDLKARGALGSDGNSSVGLFFERDY